MNNDPENIAAITSLGYTQEEARFLYIVAIHSGYFVLRQFLTSSGAKCGRRSHQFATKLESRGHATWREYHRTGGVYHLVSKTIYRRIGNENLRNRRGHSVDFIRTRLLLLDFILANPSHDYLETEADKLGFLLPRTWHSAHGASRQGLRRRSSHSTHASLLRRSVSLVCRSTRQLSYPRRHLFVRRSRTGQSRWLCEPHPHLSPALPATRGFLLPLYSRFTSPFRARRTALFFPREGAARSRCFDPSSAVLPAAQRMGAEEIWIALDRRCRMAQGGDAPVSRGPLRRLVPGMDFRCSDGTRMAKGVRANGTSSQRDISNVPGGREPRKQGSLGRQRKQPSTRVLRRQLYRWLRLSGEAN